MTWKTDTVTGWGRVLSATGEVARPERASALPPLSAEGPAVGNRRSYGDAALNSGGRAIDMTRLDRLLAFDAATGELTVEAGAMLGDIARAFAPKGWLPAVMPGTGLATVGGAIGNDVHGKNHHVQGSFGQHVSRLTLLQDGKPVEVAAGTELFRATAGGLGQTGVIAEATLRLMPVRGDLMMVTERRVGGWDEHIAALDAARAPYAVGWIDAGATGAELGRGIVEEGETGSGLVPRRAASRSVPVDLGLFVNGPFVRAFNALYWRRVPESGRTVVKPITDFFFPLDRIHRMNRLYGRKGFHQFQCVVPPGATETLREMVERTAASGLASPLAVLKRMGDGRAGMLSFPMEGWTLAVDFPNSDPARRLIADLHELTQLAGGRVYLAKDSLLAPERVATMYPDLATWRAAVAQADPAGRMATDMVRRLGLRAT
jgi:decaprenylphospho-beta-D-ribofuranose 2-oxidase